MKFRGRKIYAEKRNAPLVEAVISAGSAAPPVFASMNRSTEECFGGKKA